MHFYQLYPSFRQRLLAAEWTTVYLGFALGRADHYWEGFRHYTDKGQHAVFSEFIGTLSAKEREVFRFPPADHAYYSKQTLALLEKQYPGWNARDEYKASE